MVGKGPDSSRSNIPIYPLHGFRSGFSILEAFGRREEGGELRSFFLNASTREQGTFSFILDFLFPFHCDSSVIVVVLCPRGGDHDATMAKVVFSYAIVVMFGFSINECCVDFEFWREIVLKSVVSEWSSRVGCARAR